jgi:hypothetical protein
VVDVRPTRWNTPIVQQEHSTVGEAVESSGEQFLPASTASPSLDMLGFVADRED